MLGRSDIDANAQNNVIHGFGGCHSCFGKDAAYLSAAHIQVVDPFDLNGLFRIMIEHLSTGDGSCCCNEQTVGGGQGRAQKNAEVDPRICGREKRAAHTPSPCGLRFSRDDKAFGGTLASPLLEQGVGRRDGLVYLKGKRGIF